jgi:hypothetical protein
MEACYGGTDVMERSCAVARGIDINIRCGAVGNPPHAVLKLKPHTVALMLNADLSYKGVVLRCRYSCAASYCAGCSTSTNNMDCCVMHHARKPNN